MTVVEDPFERLHPAVAHHIVNTLGWSRLRPLQRAAIEPVLAGHHAILLAPTAGGKTEAAVLPLFSRMLAEDWRGLGVLYLCPIKALLNNLEARLARYAGLFGRRAALWHGDVSASTKGRLAADPPDILLTTPESLEVMLVSGRIDHRRLFAGLRCVVVDEVHAFAGDDRGWHLLFLLARLGRISGVELQRLGLSATVGNPARLLDWLAVGCERPRVVLDPPAAGVAGSRRVPDCEPDPEPDPNPHPQPEVELDWVASLANAALVISRLHRGEKRLVFCDSRARAEELALELRARGVQTYVSHSSLGREERQAAEAAFAQGSDCVIVATSTLELGIDVGDLDRVIQIDAPGTVAAFLQRIGRTGRRPGSSRNCLFLVTREDAFLTTAALLQLWSEGFVEPVVPPPLPLHILAQQVMALALQEGGIGAADWWPWLAPVALAAGVGEAEAWEVVSHMRASGILHGDQGLLWIGREGEEAFGRRHFMDLLSVFTSPPSVRVMHGRQELGEVHQSTFMVADQGPAVLTLAGRAWKTRHLDWARRLAYVEPTDARGRSRWMGAGQALHFDLCQAMTRVLHADHPPAALSRRAREHLEELRAELDWVEPGHSLLVEDWEGGAGSGAGNGSGNGSGFGTDGRSDRRPGGGVVWWTFAGRLLNAALGAALSGQASKVTSDDLRVRFEGGVEPQSLRDAIAALLGESDASPQVPLDEGFVEELKFGACLPPRLRERVLLARYDRGADFARLRALPLRRLRLRGGGGGPSGR